MYNNNNNVKFEKSCKTNGNNNVYKVYISAHFNNI